MEAMLGCYPAYPELVSARNGWGPCARSRVVADSPWFRACVSLLPRAGRGWIGRRAEDQATEVFIRGHGARDVALGAGALATLARGEPRRARDWMSAQALADGADVAATLASRRHLPGDAFRFALAMTAVSTGVAAASAMLLGD